MRPEGDYKNPRSANGALRRKNRTRIRAMGDVCHICGKPIHYDEPSDSKHPLSFVIDEIIPVSRWKEFSYDSPRQVAEDFNNLAPAHWICNQKKSNHTPAEMARLSKPKRLINISDGDW